MMMTKVSRRKERTMAIVLTEMNPECETHTQTHAQQIVYFSAPDLYAVVMCSYLLN